MDLQAYKKGTGLHTTDEPRFQYDYYKQVTTMELINLTVKMVSNPDYTGEEEVVVDRPINSEEYAHIYYFFFFLLKSHSYTCNASFVTYAFESFKSFFKDIRFAFINPDDDDFVPTETASLRSRFFPTLSNAFSPSPAFPPAPASSPSGSPRPAPRLPPHDHAKFETIIQSGYPSKVF